MNSDIIYIKHKVTKHIPVTKESLKYIFYPPQKNIFKTYQILPGITYLQLRNIVLKPEMKIICNSDTSLILDNCTIINGITIEGGKVNLISPKLINNNQKICIEDAEEINIIQDESNTATYILDAKRISIDGNKNKVHEIINNYNTNKELEKIKKRVKTLSQE